MKYEGIELEGLDITQEEAEGWLRMQRLSGGLEASTLPPGMYAIGAPRKVKGLVEAGARALRAQRIGSPAEFEKRMRGTAIDSREILSNYGKRKPSAGKRPAWC